jgi:hypothetical protein
MLKLLGFQSLRFLSTDYLCENEFKTGTCTRTYEAVPFSETGVNAGLKMQSYRVCKMSQLKYQVNYEM